MMPRPYHNPPPRISLLGRYVTLDENELQYALKLEYNIITTIVLFANVCKVSLVHYNVTISYTYICVKETNLDYRLTHVTVI